MFASLIFDVVCRPRGLRWLGAGRSELTIALADGPRRLHSIDQQVHPAVSAGQVSVQD
jgi:hypothetical protein